MAQTIAAYLIVAVAAVWVVRRFWPRRRAAPHAPAAKSPEACENCDCGR